MKIFFPKLNCVMHKKKVIVVIININVSNYKSKNLKNF